MGTLFWTKRDRYREEDGRWFNNYRLSDTRYSTSIAIYPRKIPNRRIGFALCRRRDDGRWYLYCWAQQAYSWQTLREAMRVSLVMCRMGLLDNLSSSNRVLK